MGRSFQILSIAGIPIKIHWSLFLLPIFIIGMGVISGSGSEMILLVLAFISVTFICVILHEYGHALTAKKYGIHTKDIIISIAGGIARLKRIPNEALKEFQIAFAGPLVNLVIFFLLFIPLFLTGEISHPFDSAFYQISDRIDYFQLKDFVPLIMYINAALFLFNLIPAFPMDGGRMFRSLLSLRFSKLKATYYSMMLSRIMAFLMICFGLYYQYFFFAFVGTFILIMGSNEYKMIWIEELLDKYQLKDIVRSTPARIESGMTLSAASKMSKETGERDFLVYSDKALIGVLSAEYLNDGIKRKLQQSEVQEFLRPAMNSLDEAESLKDFYYKINNDALCVVEVKQGEKLIGTASRSSLNQFIRDKYRNRNNS